MRKYTIRGRVVYDRKHHPFSIRDLLRIGKTLDAELVELSGTGSGSAWADIQEAIGDARKSDEVVVTVPDFGGGRVGGAGSTRTFGGISAKRIVIIVERE